MDSLTQFLATYKNSKVSILQLADQLPNVTYEQFALQIQTLEQQNLLIPVKASGLNGKQPPLANIYKINKMYVRQTIQQQVKKLKKTLHSSIWVEYYLTKTIADLEQDLPALKQLHQYLQTNGFPKTKALAQERSFEIFQDEKWITDKGGKHFLEKLKVWDYLEIWPIADPVSFALNPLKMSELRPKLLIVENKATFYNLLPALKDSSFTALLYGQGNAINGTIQVLPEQLPLNYDNVTFYYFGDIDAEGISIWHLLNQKYTVNLALPFYIACLEKQAVKGKEYQRQNVIAIENFVEHFSEENKQKVTTNLRGGFYYPQEILSADQLQQIWRNAQWT